MNLKAQFENYIFKITAVFLICQWINCQNSPGRGTAPEAFSITSWNNAGKEMESKSFPTDSISGSENKYLLYYILKYEAGAQQYPKCLI